MLGELQLQAKVWVHTLVVRDIAEALVVAEANAIRSLSMGGFQGKLGCKQLNLANAADAGISLVAIDKICSVIMVSSRVLKTKCTTNRGTKNT